MQKHQSIYLPLPQHIHEKPLQRAAWTDTGISIFLYFLHRLKCIIDLVSQSVSHTNQNVKDNFFRFRKGEHLSVNHVVPILLGFSLVFPERLLLL